MTVLFETLRGLFFMMTLLLIIFLVTGGNMIDEVTFGKINSVLMPAYLVLAGIVMGYILNLIGSDVRESHEVQERNGSTAYIQGLVIGIILALIYIFMG